MSTSKSGNKNQEGGMSPDNSIYRIPPHYYLHVLDQTSNITRVEIGPRTYIRQENERVVIGPKSMVIIPPGNYCIVQNPILRDDKGTPKVDSSGQIKLTHGDLEVRLEQVPFPLYPGEILYKDVTPLKIVPSNSALRLKALQDFDDKGVARIAGDEWLFEGPGTYIPRKEVEVNEVVRATVIMPNQALKLRARTETKDRDGNQRVTGEEWLVKRVGAYLPGAYEEIVDVVNAYVLTEKSAIIVQATRTFTDEFQQQRKNGEEWLITMKDTETYIPGVYERVMQEIAITVLSNRQYCVIVDPIGADGKPQLGKRKLVKGEASFFLCPGENLERGIQDIYVLGDNEGLMLTVKESYFDSDTKPPVQRIPGDRWMIRGPVEYIPPIEVEVITQRYAIPLDENEGIYVRDVKSGRVRSVIGHTYMLNHDEELWKKELPPLVEELLSSSRDHLADRGNRVHVKEQPPARDKTKVVTLRVPHNAAVQIYDYKKKEARVVFGPDLVMLGPDEQFTQISLSGGQPKRPNVVRALCLLLGPDFCTDVITVETADHARLSLQLSYNWHFDLGDKSAEVATKLFSVPDFIGDLCKAVASRIRGAVAGVNFDDFHKNSAKIIRSAVFGYDESQKIRNNLKFPQNNLVITCVDIQGVEPVDQRTRDSLQKSVQLAIEITTQSQEAAAKHEAERREQEARGHLERQRISDEVEAERARKQLLELQASSMAVESCGQAKAEAQSRAEAQKIEGEAAVEQAKLKTQALQIEAETELTRLKNAREAEVQYIQELNELEIDKTHKLANIEVEKFKNMVGALGSDTIKSIALAGPELQAKLLQGLGIKTTLITDGNTPINLFTTAQGLLGNAASVATSSELCLEPSSKVPRLES